MRRVVYFSAVVILLISDVGTTTRSSGKEKCLDVKNGDKLPPGAIRRFGSERLRAGCVYDLDLSADRKIIATAGADICLWNIATRTKMKQFTLPGPVSWQRVYLPAKGDLLVGFSYQGWVTVWNRRTGEHLRTIKMTNKGKITAVAVSPDGKVLATGSEKGDVLLWKLPAGRFWKQGPRFVPVMTAPRPGQVPQMRERYVTRLVFSPDGKYLVASEQEHDLILWNMKTMREERRYHHFDYQVGELVFSPDGLRLASSGNYVKGGKNKRGICIWDVATGKILQEIEGAEAWSMGLAFSDDGVRMAYGGGYCRVNVWDFELGKKIFTSPRQSGAVQGVRFAKGGRRVFAAHGYLSHWDLATGRDLLQKDGHTAQIRAVAISRDAKLVASASVDCTTRIWRTNSGRQVRLLTGHEDMVNGVTFSPTGKMLATASQDATVRFWEVSTGKSLRIIRHPTKERIPFYQVQFSSDGKTLAVASDNLTVYFFDVATGKLKREFRGYTGYSLSTGVSFGWSGDEKTMAVIGGVGPGGIKAGGPFPRPQQANPVEMGYWVQIWEVHSGTIRKKLGKLVHPTLVSLSPDGKTVVLFDGGTLKWFDVKTGQVRHRVVGASPPLRFSGDGKIFAAGDKLFFDDPAKPAVRLPVGNVSAIAFSHDGTKMVTGHQLETQFYLWDLAQLRKRRP